MTPLETIKRDTQLLVFSLLITNFVFSAVAYIAGNSQIASNVVWASVFLTMNLIFYMVLAAAILVKKNIAWMGPVIVIKYLFLLVSVYFIWAKGDVLFVLSGMFVELFLIIISYMVFKKVLSERNTVNGSF